MGDRYEVRTGADSKVISAWSHSINAQAAATAMRMSTGLGYYVYDTKKQRVVRDLLPTRKFIINQWGNVVGYISGRKVKEFGMRDGWNEKEAAAWVEGRENEEWWK